ncbi:MAG: NAD-dependent epimerase/dehydratase family protein, partial [Phycisphaeraceae bacterium]|nr:NAD-dependent epimerase/dehydratase family protein [Phycisphaeraceae bacterium]
MSDMPRIVIAGGTGFLGGGLAAHLAAGDREVEVVALGRHEPAEEGPFRFTQWDGRSTGDWVAQLNGATAVVNLAGRSVDCIKTPDHCDEILRSRVEATDVLGEAVRAVNNPPTVWVQMSTAHIYGDPPERVCNEDSAPGYGLAPFVGAAWEEAFERAVLDSMRSVVLRTSFVLGRTGGALPRLASLTRWRLGGKSGHGRQGMSWIHEQDMVRLFERALTDESMEGIYVATAPNPVSNATFMQELRRAMGVPIGLPAAEWMVRIGAPLVMRTDPALALYGRYCVSRRLTE